MSTLPIIAGNQNPLAPNTLGLPVVNVPGMQLPTTTDVIQNIPDSGVAKPGHFMQLIVDGPSAFNGPVYFGASQRTAWFDCSPATVDPTVILDFASGPQQYLFLTRDTIVWLPTTDQQEGMFFVMVQQDAVGAHLLTWKINNPTVDGSAVVIWLAGSLPVMSSAAHSVRLYTFTWCQNLNGGLGAYVGSSTTDIPTGLVSGPISSVAGHLATFVDTTGKVLADGGAVPTTLPASDVYAWAKAASPPAIGPFISEVDRSDGNDYSLAGRTQGIYAIAGAGSNGPGPTYLNLIHAANASDVAFQIAGGYNSDAMYFRGTSGLHNGTGYTPWRTVLHSGNFGSFALPLAGGTMTGNIVMPDEGTIGQAAGPLIAFDDTNNYLEITGCNVGIGTTTPAEKLHVIGNMQVEGQAHIGQYTNGTAYINAHDGYAFYGCDSENGFSISHAGNGSVGNDLYVGGNMSALSITDRTPVYEGDALAELIKIKGKDGKIDHSTLPAFARHVTTLQVASETEKDEDGKAVMVETQEEGRDLGAMISMLTVAVKQLNDRLLAVEKK